LYTRKIYVIAAIFSQIINQKTLLLSYTTSQKKRHNILNIYIATDSFSQFTQLNIITINYIYNEQLYTTLLGQAKESTEMYGFAINI